MISMIIRMMEIYSSHFHYKWHPHVDNLSKFSQILHCGTNGGLPSWVVVCWNTTVWFQHGLAMMEDHSGVPTQRALENGRPEIGLTKATSISYLYWVVFIILSLHLSSRNYYEYILIIQGSWCKKFKINCYEIIPQVNIQPFLKIF